MGDKHARISCGTLGIEGCEKLRLVRVKSFYIDSNSAATGEAGAPGRLVGDTEFKHAASPCPDHIECFGDDIAFDAAARDRAKEIAIPIDDKMAADRTRG